jgi:hypothetical protein
MDPPENAIILCVDGKTQIQAPGRTRPVLPILPGVPERRTTDYVGHGTTTLFAAPGVLSGNVTGECRGAHKAEDHPAFLKEADKESEKGKAMHSIADNYATHKTGVACPEPRDGADRGRKRERATPVLMRFLIKSILYDEPYKKRGENASKMWFSEVPLRCSSASAFSDDKVSLFFSIIRYFKKPQYPLKMLSCKRFLEMLLIPVLFSL